MEEGLTSVAETTMVVGVFLILSIELRESEDTEVAETDFRETARA